MRSTLTCGGLFVCSAALAFAFAQEPARLGAAIESDGLDGLLADFTAATATLDVERAERLFLPPDDTPDGKNRLAHVSELRKDWKRVKESGASAGPSVQFKNARKIIRADMLVSGPGGPQGQVSEVEFVVAFTKDGWRIVSMDIGKTR